MIFVKATQTSETGAMPSQELIEAMGKYNQELIASGIMHDGAGLQPSSRGARETLSGKDADKPSASAPGSCARCSGDF